MPTYEYRCDECGVFECFQKISASPLEKCPDCGSEVERLISCNPYIIFKGSGFYTTDYGTSSTSGNGSKNGSGKEKNNETKDSSAATKKKDSAGDKTS